MKDLVLRVYLFLRRALLWPFRLSPRGGRVGPEGPAKVLLIRVDRIGDMVMTMPAARVVKKRYPGARVFFLASRGAAGLLSGDPYVDGVFLYPEGGGPAAKLKLLRALRAEKFSLALDFMPDYTLRTALLAFLSGAVSRAGYDGAGRGAFFTVPVEPSFEGKHTLEIVLQLLRAAGMSCEAVKPELFVTEEARAGAAALLGSRGAGPADPVAAVHPGGYYPSQRWQPEGFAAAINWLIDERGARILLIGSRAELGLLDSIVAMLPEEKRARVIPACDIPLPELSALLERSFFFLGNNSGPLHMACALGLPSVSMMGPTDPVKWRPLCGRQEVLRADIACSPCELGFCGEHACMKEIKPAMVIGAMRRVLGGGKADARG